MKRPNFLHFFSLLLIAALGLPSSWQTTARGDLFRPLVGPSESDFTKRRPSLSPTQKNPSEPCPLGPPIAFTGHTLGWSAEHPLLPKAVLRPELDRAGLESRLSPAGLEAVERPIAQRWSEQESIAKRDEILLFFNQKEMPTDSSGYKYKLDPDSLKVYHYAGGAKRNDFIAAYGAEKWVLQLTRGGSYPTYPNERAIFVRVGALFFIDLDEFNFLEDEKQEAIRKILGGNMLLVPELQTSTVANLVDREMGIFGVYTYATIAAMLQADRLPERMVIAGVVDGDLLLALGALGVQYLEGFDLREDVVVQANEKLKINGFKNINVFVGDLTQPQQVVSRLIFNGRETGFVGNIGTWPDLYNVTNQDLIPLIKRVSQDSPVTLFFGAGYLIRGEETEVPKAILEDQSILENEGFRPSLLVTSLGFNDHAVTWSATRPAAELDLAPPDRAGLEAVETIDLTDYVKIGSGRQSIIFQSPDTKKVVRVFRGRVEEKHVAEYVEVVNGLPEMLEGVIVPRVKMVKVQNVPGGAASAQYGVLTDFFEGQTVAMIRADFELQRDGTVGAGREQQFAEHQRLEQTASSFLDEVDQRTGGLADRHYGPPGWGFHLESTLANFLVTSAFLERGNAIASGPVFRFREGALGKVQLVAIDPIGIAQIIHPELRDRAGLEGWLALIPRQTSREEIDSQLRELNLQKISPRSLHLPGGEQFLFEIAEADLETAKAGQPAQMLITHLASGNRWFGRIQLVEMGFFESPSSNGFGLSAKAFWKGKEIPFWIDLDGGKLDLHAKKVSLGIDEEPRSLGVPRPDDSIVSLEQPAGLEQDEGRAPYDFFADWAFELKAEEELSHSP